MIPPADGGDEGETLGEATIWKESLARVIPAIVVVRVCSVGAFDGEGAGYARATGFVVDKDRGIILTNRHVVTPGPTMADAVFMNKEEVDLVPIYYDPVHDFGFYRFDPKAVKFLDIAEIELNPEGAKVGVEIRVVGNDSGEKLSILPGILARLDRAAPEYDSAGYRDFNTFYLAAASSTSGGSSGSPVLTVDGKAVALNCGARVETAAAFYLPLPKITRALELLQKGEKVTRGTIQAVLKHTAFDEARRLGLKPDTEALLREEFPEETGVLSVGEVLPKGPADGALEPGDVVIRMDGEMITTFLPWESALDDGVGGEVEVEVQRGGKVVALRLKVGDLHAITPSEFLEVSASVLHPLSYQQARNYNLPVEGVYLAQAGYMLERAWIASQCIITSVGSDPTPDLDACEAALCKHPDGARVSVRFKSLADRHRTKTAVITIDRKWFTMQRVRRNDQDGLWHATPSPLPPSPPPPPPPPPAPPSRESKGKEGKEGKGRKAKSKNKSKGKGKGKGEGKGKGAGEDEAGGISSSLVMVLFDIPHLVDGVSGSYCVGVGVVVDKELGLVVVDKTTVQVSLGDVMLTFNGSEEVVARPIFSHPIQNFSVVQFDPSLVRGSYTAAVLSSREMEHDEEEEEAVEEGGTDTDTDTDSDGEEGGDGDGGGAENGSETSKDAAAGKEEQEEQEVETEVEHAPPAGTAKPSSSPLPPTPTPTPTPAASQVATGSADAGRGAGDPDHDSPPPLRPGDTAEFYGLTAANAPVRQRAAVVKLERISLPTSSHPQFTAHSVEVLQFDQIASCLGGVFIANPRSDTPSSSSSSSPSPSSSSSSSSTPVVSAFWHSFAFSTTEGRKHANRGLPAPVVRRAVERIRRDLLKKEEEGECDSSQQQQQQQQQQQVADEEEAEEQQGERREEQSSSEVAAADGEGEKAAAAAVGPQEVPVDEGTSPTAEVPAVEGELGAAEEAAEEEGADTDVIPAAPATATATAPEPEETTKCHTVGGGATKPPTGEGEAAATPTVVLEAEVNGEHGTEPAADSEGGGEEETDDEEARKGEPESQPPSSVVTADGTGGCLLGAAPCLPLQLVTVELSKARAGLGLSDEWAGRVERKCGKRRQKQVLEVRRCMVGTPAFSVVETGDIILAVDGKTVTRFRDVELAVEEAEGRPVRLTILRQLEEQEVTVTPSHLPTRETDRLFMWAGQMVQAPHLAVLQLGFLPKEGGGVYSSRWCYGSPAHKYNLGCTNWIVEVNGVPTPTLDAFLDVVKHIGDKSTARVKTVGLDSKVEVTTLRTDHHYWPTLELRRSGDGWTRTLHKGGPGTASNSNNGRTISTTAGSSSSSADPEVGTATTSTASSSELFGEEESDKADDAAGKVDGVVVDNVDDYVGKAGNAVDAEGDGETGEGAPAAAASPKLPVAIAAEEGAGDSSPNQHLAPVEEASTPAEAEGEE